MVVCATGCRGGLSLPQLMQAEQLAGIRKSHKAVIMIYLVGAPPHQDMFDLKMEALDVSKEPAAVRERYGKGDPKNHG